MSAEQSENADFPFEDLYEDMMKKKRLDIKKTLKIEDQVKECEQ